MSNFHPLEVVGRSSETQLQVDDFLNKIKKAEKKHGGLDQLSRLFNIKYIFSVDINIFGSFEAGNSIRNYIFKRRKIESNN